MNNQEYLDEKFNCKAEWFPDDLLTAEEEDYMIESGLEEIRLRREEECQD